MTHLIASTRGVRTASIGEGSVVLDSQSGSPLQFVHPSDPARRYLLDESVLWHSVEHRWGSGFVITDDGAGRWNSPSALLIDDTRSEATYPAAAGISVSVVRTFGQIMRERFVLTNVTDRAIRITGVGVQTPFADHYADARSSLESAVHAHVFAGGEWAWALAQPMSGTGPLLGLIVRQGGLDSYSLESRNPNTLSNARGHLVLQPTDHARNADAFGGQRVIPLMPGENYTLEWEIGWFTDIDTFLAATDPPAQFERFSGSIREGVAIIPSPGVQVSSPDPNVRIEVLGHRSIVMNDHPGPVTLQFAGRGRTEVLLHESIREAIPRRARYILDHQRTLERPGSLQFAVVPVDTRTGLTRSTNGWSDWTDGSERTGMAILLQRARNAGWLPGSDVGEFLAGWTQFAREHLVDVTGEPRRGSQDGHTGARLYDSPWLAQFFLDRFRGEGDTADLLFAQRIIERAIELGAERFLGVLGSEAHANVANALHDAGYLDDATRLRQHLVDSADYFIGLGPDLPPHEVIYEQSIVAPLVDLLIDAHRITGDSRYIAEIRDRLPWLEAFGGPQPHFRLNQVPIRHWDGYWFGEDRLWGDVFPHHWSSLTASTLLRLPRELRSERLEAVALGILRANMASYFPDGTATCAFVMPSTVDGRAAHSADPLANDQDWHLAIWLKLHLEGDAPDA